MKPRCGKNRGFGHPVATGSPLVCAWISLVCRPDFLFFLGGGWQSSAQSFWGSCAASGNPTPWAALAGATRRSRNALHPPVTMVLDWFGVLPAAPVNQNSFSKQHVGASCWFVRNPLVA